MFSVYCAGFVKLLGFTEHLSFHPFSPYVVRGHGGSELSLPFLDLSLDTPFSGPKPSETHNLSSAPRGLHPVRLERTTQS